MGQSRIWTSKYGTVKVYRLLNFGQSRIWNSEYRTAGIWTSGYGTDLDIDF